MTSRLSSLFLTCSLTMSAAWAGTFSFTCSTSKEPLSYQPGEPMQFKVQLIEDGRPLAGKTLKWLRTGDDGQTANGEAMSSDVKPLEIASSMAKPGFVRIEISAFNPDGSPLKDTAGETVKFDGGAGVQPEKLEGYPEPADFDAFWQKQKARLAEIPITAELREVAAKQPGFKVYDVRIACAGKRPVTGYLSIPVDAKGKSLSAQVGFHGYGVSGSDQQCQAGTIFFDVNAHGIENGREPEYYKALREGELKNYGLINEENAKPGTAYFNGMMLRAMRALQYVKTRPEWNGRDLLVSGGSQGGFQAIAAAALDQQVTGCYAWKPWCCDLGGIRLNRLRGWRPDFADGLGYYDTATMGRRVTCETTIVAGLGDYVCPPSGLAVLYNNLKSTKKSIEFTQGATHGTQPAGAVKQVFRFAALEFHVSPAGNDANDGSTPQRAFRSLAAACRAVPAGKHIIRIAAGDYEEKESCILPAGVSLIGAGTGKTVFRWNAVRDLDKKPMEYDFAAFLIQMKDSADATISGLTIIGSLPEDKRAHGGIIAQRVRNVAIHDCELRGLEFTGVWLSDATHSSVHHCRFDDCAHPSKESCSGALQLGTLADCTIHHNTIREKRGAYGIKTWVPLWTALRNNWFELGRNKVKLVRVHIHDNDIKVRQQGGWGNGQPNMALELWNSDPVECEIYSNRFNECVSLVEGAKSPNTIRIHHNLFILEPGYSYAIEAGHHNLEIDHNVFRNGFYPIASFGDAISGLNIHDNTFDGIENIAVCLLPGVSNFRFINNTVVVKKDMPILVAEKERGKPSHSKDVTIADNLLVKEGAPSQAKVMELKDGSELAPGTLTMRGNAFWNWTPAGEAAMTADPQLERAADGDRLLRMSSKSPVRAAGKGADAGVTPADAGAGGVNSAIGPASPETP